MNKSGLSRMRGVVIHWYQSEARSSHCAAATVGQPMSTWKPAIALPKTKPFGKVPMTGASGGVVGGDGVVGAAVGAGEPLAGAPLVGSLADDPHAPRLTAAAIAAARIAT
jgi:hypothetical protein